jgi:3-phytase
MHFQPGPLHHSAQKHPFLALRLLISCSLLLLPSLTQGSEIETFKPTMQLVSPEVKDQDDMCVWKHPTHPAQSTVICSDKSSNSVFVYDLAGKLLQRIEISKPGNVDIRQSVRFDGGPIDLVVLNQRADGFKLCVFKVNIETHQLERLDNNQLLTGPNYGGCMYHSKATGRVFFICTSDQGTVEQHELLSDGKGGIRGQKVRSWPIGKCEGAVADDQAAAVYISEEKRGVWKFDAEPDAPTAGTLIAKVGEHGLKGDVEGLAIVSDSKGTGLLLVSDQGANRFAVYQRQQPYNFVGEFSVSGAQDSDGIELSVADFGPQFPQGFFACHTDRVPRGVLLTPWHNILAKLSAMPLETK